MKRLSMLALAVLAATVSPALADAPSNADKITDFAIGKLNAVFDGVTKAMPTVAKYTLEVTSMNCLFNVIQIILLGLIPIAGWSACRWMWKKAEADSQYSEWWIGTFLIMSISALGSIIYLTALVDNIWSFIGIFHPDLYLIHMALQKVTG